MKIYNFSYSWHEEYGPHVLLHPTDKTQEQFADDCKKALRAVGPYYLVQEKSWAGAPDWIKYSLEYMVKELGYEVPEETHFRILWLIHC